MSNLADDLRQAADAVAVLGSSSAEYEALSDDAALAGQKQIGEARQLLETRAAWMAATIARRSRPELGHSGLAAQQGFLSPEALIQNWTGSSRGDAHKLVAVGTMMADTEAAERLVAAALLGTGPDEPTADRDGNFPGDAAELLSLVPWQAPIARAVTAGALSVDAAESIRTGLGQIDAAVTADKLAEALDRLLAEAVALNADEVFKRARRMRDELDQAGIAAREKQAHDDRFLRVYRLRDGKVRLNGLFAPEDGEFVLSTFDSITSPRRGGVRFVDKEQAAWAKRIQDDPRTTEQIAADALVQLLKIAGEADQGHVFGGEWRCATVDASGPAATGRPPGPRRTTSSSGCGTTGTRISPTGCSCAIRTTCCCTTSTGRSSGSERSTGCGRRHPLMRSKPSCRCRASARPCRSRHSRPNRAGTAELLRQAGAFDRLDHQPVSDTSRA